MSVRHIKISQESFDVSCLAVAYDIDVVTHLLELCPCLENAFVERAAVLPEILVLIVLAGLAERVSLGTLLRVSE